MEGVDVCLSLGMFSASAPAQAFFLSLLLSLLR